MNYRRIVNTPLYQQVAAAMQADLVAPGEVGAPLPTEPEIARSYRVSVTTVRKAVDLLESRGQVKRRQGSGVYILRNRALRRVGALIDYDLFSSEVPGTLHRIILQVYRQAARHGVELVPFFGSRNFAEEPMKEDIPEAFMQALGKRSIDGVLAIGSLPFEYWVDVAEQHAIPIVGTSYGFSSSVRWDQKKFLELALETAVLNGKRKVAFIIGSRTDMPLYRHYQKVDEIAAALAEQYGVQTYREWTRSDYSICLAGAGWELFRDLWSSRDEKPDCVVVGDLILPDVVDAAISMEIEPLEELLLVAATPEQQATRVPYPVVRIETSSESMMAEALLDEVTRRIDGSSPRHLLVPPTNIYFDQHIYKQVPALSLMRGKTPLEAPLLPGMKEETFAILEDAAV